MRLQVGKTERGKITLEEEITGQQVYAIPPLTARHDVMHLAKKKVPSLQRD